MKKQNKTIITKNTKRKGKKKKKKEKRRREKRKKAFRPELSTSYVPGNIFTTTPRGS